MKKGESVHLVGIGGVSMSGIAISLAKLGFRVSGSDVSDENTNSYLKEIKNFGKIKIFKGHVEENIEDDLGALILTSTISEDNPEVIKARKIGAKILQRFEAINLIISEFAKKVGVFGGAGKTTTTALTFCLFQNAKLSPSLFLGSVMQDLKASVHLEEVKEYCIFETDESDASFEHMSMNAGIFVAMEADHLDHKAYSGSYKKMKECFKNLLLKLKKENAPVCFNKDSYEVAEMVEEVLGDYQKKLSFSIKDKGADFYAEGFKFVYGGMSFNIYKKGKLFMENVFMPLIGEFNALNMLGGVAMLSFFVEEEGIKHSIQSLKHFKGIDKRQTKVGEFGSFDVIDDYAHSPLKIQSMLSGFVNYAKAINAGFIPVCEIHKISRFEGMYESYLTCFSDVPFLVLMDVYKVPGYKEKNPDLEKFIKDIKANNKEIEIVYIPNTELTKELSKLMKGHKFKQNGKNFLLFFGAGLSSKYAKEMQKNLEELEKELSKLERIAS